MSWKTLSLFVYSQIEQIIWKLPYPEGLLELASEPTEPGPPLHLWFIPVYFFQNSQKSVCLQDLGFTFGHCHSGGPTGLIYSTLGKKFCFVPITANPAIASYVSRMAKSVSYFSILSVPSWFHTAFLTNINKIWSVIFLNISNIWSEYCPDKLDYQIYKLHS